MNPVTVIFQGFYCDVLRDLVTFVQLAKKREKYTSKSATFSKVAGFQETADLVTFTEEILHGKLHFLCSEYKFHPAASLKMNSRTLNKDAEQLF